jgi:carbonic anhydrase
MVALRSITLDRRQHGRHGACSTALIRGARAGDHGLDDESSVASRDSSRGAVVSDLSTLYERNAAFATSFDKGELPITPSLSTLILTCVDARVDPAHYAGLELGDAPTLRNVGARVTEAVGLEVSMLWMLMSMTGGATPDIELVIVQHTRCGMARFAEPDVAEQVTARFGSPSVVDTYGITDLSESLNGDIERLRSNSVVPRALKVSGHIYDIATGQLSEVVATRTVG